MHKVCAETLSSVSVRRRYDGADCVSFTLIFLFNENTISHSFISRGFSFPNRPPGFKSALETKISKLKPPDNIKHSNLTVWVLFVLLFDTFKAVRESDEMRPHGETDTETDTTKKNEPDGVYPCPAFFIASRKILAASLMLSSVAWVYIRSVTALSLWPRASETLATSAPLVIATLAKVWRSLWG